MKPAGQVIASARNMDAAVAAGLPHALLLVLIRGRNVRDAAHAAGLVFVPDVEVLGAAMHGAAPLFDEVFVAQVRRHARAVWAAGLS